MACATALWSAGAIRGGNLDTLLNCCAQENILAQVEAAAKSAPPKPPKAEPKPKGKVESLTDALTFKAGEPGADQEEVIGSISA